MLVLETPRCARALTVRGAELTNSTYSQKFYTGLQESFTHCANTHILATTLDTTRAGGAVSQTVSQK